MLCRLFWRTLRLTYPWLPLVLTLWRIAISTGMARTQAQLRFWRLYSRIDVAALLAFVIDMTQPEFWV